MGIDEPTDGVAAGQFEEERFDAVLAGIERRNRRMLRTAVLLVVFVTLATVAVSVFLADLSQDDGPVLREDAVALVLSQDRMFAAVREFDSQAIGQSDWWIAEEVSGGWQVTVRLGWGDCPAGCISEHRYRYEVRGDVVTLLEEYGDPLSTRP